VGGKTNGQSPRGSDPQGRGWALGVMELKEVRFQSERAWQHQIRKACKGSPKKKSLDVTPENLFTCGILVGWPKL
jgi:hypothetical protein